MRYLFSCLMIGAVVAIAGCSSSTGPETAMVSGTVYLDGAPAAAVDVKFMNGTHSAFARTDAEGNFELATGAAVGENTVYFSKFDGAGFELNPDEGMDEGQLMAMRDPGVPSVKAPKQLIPAPYSDPGKTTVSFVVPSGGSDAAEFKLLTK